MAAANTADVPTFGTFFPSATSSSSTWGIPRYYQAWWDIYNSTSCSGCGDLLIRCLNNLNSLNFKVHDHWYRNVDLEVSLEPRFRAQFQCHHECTRVQHPQDCGRGTNPSHAPLNTPSLATLYLQLLNSRQRLSLNSNRPIGHFPA